MKNQCWMRAGILIAMSAFTSPSIRAQATWQQLTPSTVPPGRGNHNMAYDVGRDRIVMFGGYDGGQCAFDDTWEFDGQDWIVASPAQTPPGRMLGAMAYDPIRRETVLFGGFGLPTCDFTNYTPLNDTWVWDGTDWTERMPTNQPTPRGGAAMVFHAASGRLLLFGGTMETNFNGGTLQETWEWDGTDWTQLNPATSPSARVFFGLAYDPIRERSVLFGGWDNVMNTASTADTWEWDGTTWTDVTPMTGPALRNSARLAFDVSTGAIVLYGGDESCANNYDGTWSWDGTAWTERIMMSTPGYRHTHGLAYHQGSRSLVMFGGVSTTCQFSMPTDETWAISDPQAGSFLPYGAGCGNPRLQLFGDPMALPRVGQMLGIGATNIAMSAAVTLALGDSNTMWAGGALPADLSVLGMTDCFLWTNFQSTFPMMVSGAQASFQVMLPNDPALAGFSAFTQAAALDPNANPFGVIVSNGLEVYVGQ